MKKILFKLLLKYLQKNGYEYTIGNKTHSYLYYPNGTVGLCDNKPTEILIIPTSDEYLETKVPSTKLYINPDAGHIGNVNDIALNPKGNLHISSKRKLYIKKTKKGDSAGVGTTSPDKNLEITNKKSVNHK